MRTVTFPINEAIRERINAVARRLGQGLGLTAADALDLGLAALERELLRHADEASVSADDAWREVNHILRDDLPPCGCVEDAACAYHRVPCQPVPAVVA